MDKVVINILVDDTSPAIVVPLEYDGGTDLLLRTSGGKEITRFPFSRIGEWLESVRNECDNTQAKAGSHHTPTSTSGMVQYVRSDSAEDESFPRNSGESS